MSDWFVVCFCVPFARLYQPGCLWTIDGLAGMFRVSTKRVNLKVNLFFRFRQWKSRSPPYWCGGEVKNQAHFEREFAGFRAWKSNSPPTSLRGYTARFLLSEGEKRKFRRASERSWMLLICWHQGRESAPSLVFARKMGYAWNTSAREGGELSC